MSGESSALARDFFMARPAQFNLTRSSFLLTHFFSSRHNLSWDPLITRLFRLHLDPIDYNFIKQSITLQALVDPGLYKLSTIASQIPVRLAAVQEPLEHKDEPTEPHPAAVSAATLLDDRPNGAAGRGAFG